MDSDLYRMMLAVASKIVWAAPDRETCRCVRQKVRIELELQFGVAYTLDFEKQMERGPQSGDESPAQVKVTSPSSGYTYPTNCKDCGTELLVGDEDRVETISRFLDDAPVVLCWGCYKARGNDVR